jgi:uncharacterized membrane protein YGL010W
MLSLRAHAIICASLFAALIGIPLVGNLAMATGTSPPPHAWQLPLMVFYLTLFLAFGLSAVPVMVMTVIRAQSGAIPALVRYQSRIVWILWLLILAGIAVALPAMIAGGFFNPPPERAVDRGDGGG